jgi:galactokinase
MPQTTCETPRDIDDFVERLRALDGEADGVLRGFFAADRPVWIARAPGRLDVMGGIADYSGSLVLQLPIAEATLAAVQASEEPWLRVVSLPEDGQSAARSFAVGSNDLMRLAGGSYDAACGWFRRDANRDHAWAAYVAGVVIVLARHFGVQLDRAAVNESGQAPSNQPDSADFEDARSEPGPFLHRRGLRILIDSRVPEGKGVSSSAALEVAVMQALTGCLGLTLTGGQLAHLCQEVENRVVGAPCGIMDQMTSAVGRHDQLLALLCQPAEVQGFVPVPASIRFWGIDSGIRHAVSGADYSSVRTGAFMGYRILAEAAGREIGEPDAGGVVQITDPRWRGYLANVTPDEFAQWFADTLPLELPGAEFLEKYGGITDSVTRVDPSRTYAVYQPAVHPIREHDRVRRFAALLGGSLDEAALVEMGELMAASHESYSACGLGSDGTDLLVQMVRAAGPACGVYGAKITGGGSGGTVAVLGAADAGPVVEDIAARYTRYTGRQAYVFAGSSCGAQDFGVLRLDRCTGD